MQKVCDPQGRSGFTIVEAIVAVFLLALVGMAISRTLLTTTRVLGQSRAQQKASALGEMVLEQYSALASQDAATLAAFNQTDTSPHEFFKTPDDLGYKGMRITTRAQSAANETGSEVTVKIAWGIEPSGGSLTLTKFFLDNELMPAQGASGSGI